MNEEEFIESMQEIDKEGGKEENPETIETEEGVQNEAENLSPVHQEAVDMGWTSQEDFKGDPEKWQSAGAFIEYKKLRKNIDKQKNDFDQQIKDLNKYHAELNKSQLEQQKKELERQRDEAVDDGDSESFKKNQDQIDELNKKQYELEKPQQQAANNDPAIDEWLSKNTWITTNKIKAAAADAAFNEVSAMYPGETMQNILKKVDDKLAEVFETKNQGNPKRFAPSSSETAPKRSPKTKGVTWGDLSHEEISEWNKFGAVIFKNSKKGFLKAVENVRKGQ